MTVSFQLSFSITLVSFLAARSFQLRVFSFKKFNKEGFVCFVKVFVMDVQALVSSFKEFPSRLNLKVSFAP